MKFRWLACFVPLLGSIFLGCTSGSAGEPETFAVEETQPIDGEVGVNLEALVGLRFNASIDPSTLTTQTFTLSEAGGARVQGTVAIGTEPAIALFTPDEPMTIVTTYDATITTGLLDMDGRSLEADFTWSFMTLDDAWGISETIDDPLFATFGDVDHPKVAVDPASNAIAVWQHTELDLDGLPTITNIWANRYNRRDLWGTPELIEFDDVADNRLPELAIDPEGNAFAVWERFDGSQVTIWANRYTVDQGWGEPERVQTEDLEQAGSARIAVDPNGNAIVVWLQRDSEVGLQAVKWNRYTPGTGWGTDGFVQPAEVNVGIHGLGLDVATDAEGNAIAVWTRGENVYASRYVPADAWDTPELIEPDMGRSDAPKVGMDPAGNAVAVWEHADGTPRSIRANRYTVDQGWGDPGLIESDDAGDAVQPQVSLDPNGVAHAVWSQFDGTLDNIWASRYTAGDGWSDAELIEAPFEDPSDDGDARRPQIDVDPNGNAFVVWEQPSMVWLSIWSNRYSPATGWGTAELIENLNRPAKAPQISVDPNRHAHAVWAHSDGTFVRARTNRFE